MRRLLAVCLVIGVSQFDLRQPANAAEVVPTPASDGAPEFMAPVSPDTWVGTTSCTAANCHGGAHRARPSAGDPWSPVAYPMWMQNDPHARGYETLLTEESAEIARKLGIGPAHQEQVCLACHAPEGAQRSFAATSRSTPIDGVGCEACHGPAENWVARHTTPSWRSLSGHEKARLGMRDLTSLAERARACADCHVGSPGLDVNHDLIGAGHPRLAFEMASLHARLPKHWKREQEEPAQLEMKLWAVGRIAAACASLELLADRASNPDTPWPEFSEYDCSACHHTLRDEAWRRSGSSAASTRRPGALPWNEWRGAFVEVAAEVAGVRAAPPSPDALREEMQRLLPRRPRVEALAKNLRAELWALATEAERATPDPGRLTAAMRRVTETDAGAVWDIEAQRLLALGSLHYAEAASRQPGPLAGQRRDRVRALTALLRASAPDAGGEYDAERHWTPSVQARVQTELDALRDALTPDGIAP